MKLLLQQRLFSWFDSYDIYDEMQNVCFTVQGKLALGHKLEIYDAQNTHLATLKQRVMTFMPRFEIYLGDDFVGEIVKKITFFKPAFVVNFNDWDVAGDILAWNYEIYDGERCVATIAKELLHLSDTYVIDTPREEDTLPALLVVLAIDAVKDSKN